MSENLKTLRFLHQLLMAASLAILVFAFAPDPASDYNSSLDEVGALRELSGSWQKYGQYLRSRFNPSQQQHEIDDFIQSVATYTGARVSGGLSRKIPYIANFTVQGGRIGNYLEFLEGRQSIASLVFGKDQNILPEVERQLKRLQASKNLTLESISIDGTEQLSDGTELVDFQRVRSFPLNINLGFKSTELNSERTLVTIAQLHDSIQVQESGHLALDWLKTDQLGKRLVDPASGTIFPHLRHLSQWSRVRPMGFEEAHNFLQARLDLLRNDNISFFGISVDKKLAIWMAPAVCFGVLLFLILHLRRFRTLPGETEEVATYPWIGLFSDVPSIVITFFSIAGLPPVANSLLLYEHGAHREWTTRAGAFVTVGVLGLGLLCCIEILSLNRQIAEAHGLRKANNDSDWTQWGAS